jgi:hypothetical protein
MTGADAHKAPFGWSAAAAKNQLVLLAFHSRGIGVVFLETPMMRREALACLRNSMRGIFQIPLLHSCRMKHPEGALRRGPLVNKWVSPFKNEPEKIIPVSIE